MIRPEWVASVTEAVTSRKRTFQALRNIPPGAWSEADDLLANGAFLFASGITRTVLAFRLKPQRGWGWILFDGLLSIGLALLIAIGWPQSSLAFIGLLTGFTLILTGIWRIMLRRGALA